MVRAAGLIVLGFALAGCVAVSRSASYGMQMHPSTVVLDDGRNYRVYVHPTEDTILLQRPILKGMGQAAVRGATFHLAQPGEAYDPWKRAAAMFIEPLGCKVTDVYSLGGDTGTWEARYTCPKGVDLRALVRERHGAG